VKQGIIIPVYRHGRTACQITEQLAATGLPVILVDDGNDEETRKTLAECAAKTPGVTLLGMEKNSGKGSALIRGFKKAADLGITHVLQIDADGQHDAGMASHFLEISAGQPEKVICALPVFDDTAPKSRVKGRKISSFWAAIVTLSTELKDVLCGFRVYPVREVLRIARNPFLAKRMGFDPEILVRLYWNSVFPVFHPMKVIYPAGGISNFRMIRDNIGISLMFSRLCAGMLLRLPLLIMRKMKRRDRRS